MHFTSSSSPIFSYPTVMVQLQYVLNEIMKELSMFVKLLGNAAPRKSLGMVNLLLMVTCFSKSR